MWWTLVLGCRDEAPICSDHPIVGNVPDAATVTLVRDTIARFEDWTGRPVCLSEVRFENPKGDGDVVGGQYDPVDRSVSIDPALADTPDLRALVLRHELCHMLEIDEQITASNPDAFEPPEGDWFDPASYPGDAEIRAEYFARLCSYGLLPPVVAAVEESCGRPVRLVEELVWTNAPPRPGPAVEVVPAPKVVLEPIAVFDEARVLVNDALLVRSWHPEWIPLDDLVPGTPFGSPPEARDRLVDATIPGDGELWWIRGDEGPPMRIGYDGTSSTTALDPLSWRGGWHDDRLWLWVEDDPDLELVEATGDGEVTRRSALPEPDAQRRDFVVWDGQPSMIAVGAEETRIVRLPDGETLAQLPGSMVPRRKVEGVQIGDYAYGLEARGVYVQSRDLPPNVGFAGARTGEVWLGDGWVRASSECVGGETTDGVTAHVPRVAYEDWQTTLYDAEITWSVP